MPPTQTCIPIPDMVTAFEFPVGRNRGTVTHMHDKVTVLPVPAGQRYYFLAGGRRYFFTIRAPVRRKPKPAEVIPISTTISQVGESTSADARLNLLSSPTGVMNVLTTNSGRRRNMKIFAIDSENKVTTWDSRAEAEKKGTPGAAQVSTIEELAQMTGEWPLTRLVAVWNSLPRATPLRRFTDRKTAVARIWKTLQDPAESKKVSRPARGKGRLRRKKMLAREGSKKARILLLLQRPKGATIDDIMDATGWQAHSVRGFISGNLVKRMGLRVNSTRPSGGARTYQITCR